MHKPSDRRMTRLDQRGVIATELAITLPFLLILFLSVVDLGMLIRNHQILENAAREGARYSSLPKNWVDPRNPPGSEANIRQRIIDYCSESGITLDPAQITIDQNYTIAVGSRTFRASRIEVRYQGTQLTPGTTLLVGDPVVLRSEAIFRNLY